MKNFPLIFICSLLLAITSSLHAQSWSAVGSGSIYPLKALAVYNGELYASGQGVNKWNGTNWTPVGSTSFAANLLTVFNGNLYYGGSGEVRVWDGTNWLSTGGGINTYLETLAGFNGMLYAAGNWASWSGTQDIHLSQFAAWNGSSWYSVGGVSSHSWLRSLATYNGELYLAGDFENNSIGGITAHGLAKWNGSTWSAAGTGVGMKGSNIFSLYVFNSELYALGQFDSIGNIAANGIAKWNGTSWSALGNGVTGNQTGIFSITSSMAAFNGELYVAGIINSAGGFPVNNIAKWNGTSWSALGSGIPGGYGVSALAVYANELYAGGGFDTAGSIPAKNIARWSSQCHAYIAANGSPVICSGSSVRLDVLTTTGVGYQWKLNGGNIAAATSSSYFANAAGNYSCNVTSTCGSTSTTNTIVVTVVSAAPSAIITANGATTFCAGGIITLNANTGAGLSYQWKLNGANISGRTASSLPVASSGNYSCLVSNPCGSTLSNNITVTVNSNPTATITAAGTTTFCSGSSVMLNANTGNGLSWQWKKNTVNIAGATTSSYQATSSGSYACAITNNCGSVTSNSIAVTVNNLPAQPGAISGPTSVCHNQNNVIYSIAAVATATSYTWTVPPSVQIKSGQGTLTLKVRFGNSAGNITVKANNNCGSSPLRTLTISMPCREQNDEVIEDSPSFTAYPNPSGMQFTFSVNATGIDQYSLRILDMTGRVVESYENLSIKEEFTCGNTLKNGIYIGELMLGNTRKLIRLIKSE